MVEFPGETWMRFGSLFSGIGGLDLGLERAGMECAWQVEIDEWCRRVLARHWPDVPRWDDAATFPPDAESDLWRAPWNDGRLAPDGQGVDLVVGGFPCQPVSLAGKRRGSDDERWLWPEFARIVRVLRPRYVLVENVPGLLARGMGDVLGDLAACGYDAEWDCIPAAAVGAPHLRYRVFIVAYAPGSGPPNHAMGSRRSRPARAITDPIPPDSNGERWDGRTRLFGQGRRAEPSDGSRWATEPHVGRVAHGVPSRVDRLRGLGNAVVPQVAEWIGRRLMELDT